MKLAKDKSGRELSNTAHNKKIKRNKKKKGFDR